MESIQETLDAFLTRVAIELEIPREEIPKEIAAWKRELKYIYNVDGLKEFCESSEWNTFSLNQLVKSKIAKLLVRPKVDLLYILRAFRANENIRTELQFFFREV